MYVCTHTHIYTYIYVYLHINKYIYIHIYINKYINKYEYINIYRYLSIYLHIFIYKAAGDHRGSAGGLPLGWGSRETATSEEELVRMPIITTGCLGSQLYLSIHINK